MTYRSSTNPYYDGNSEGVKAHLRNTLKLTINPSVISPFHDSERVVDNLLDSIVERWHLTPARDINQQVTDVSRLTAENESLREVVRLFQELDEINGQINDINDEGESLVAQLNELEKRADGVMEKGETLMGALDTALKAI